MDHGRDGVRGGDVPRGRLPRPEARDADRQGRKKIERALLRTKPRGAALAKAGKVPAYREAVIRFPEPAPTRLLRVYAVELAETNLTRKSFVSKPFR